MIKLILGFSVVLLSHHVFASNSESAELKTVDAFEKIFGVTKGKRRNHTKGFCFDATLVPNDAAIKQYSISPLFTKNSNVVGRLSHKGGNYKAADDKPAEYGMGLSISSTNSTHLMSMNTLDFFPVSTPEAFTELMIAKTQGKEVVKAFKNKNLDLQRFKEHVSKKDKKLRPYEGSTFNSINSFYLVNNKGENTAVRWSFVPSKEQLVVLEPKHNFFLNNMQHNLNSHAISWDMVITIANPDDVIDNPAIQWTGAHKKIIAAKLNVLSINTEKDGRCDVINYDPLVLSQGFKPSADRLLQARRNAYAIALGRRLSEKNN